MDRIALSPYPLIVLDEARCSQGTSGTSASAEKKRELSPTLNEVLIDRERSRKSEDITHVGLPPWVPPVHTDRPCGGRIRWIEPARGGHLQGLPLGHRHGHREGGGPRRPLGGHVRLAEADEPRPRRGDNRSETARRGGDTVRRHRREPLHSQTAPDGERLQGPGAAHQCPRGLQLLQERPHRGSRTGTPVTTSRRSTARSPASRTTTPRSRR